MYVCMYSQNIIIQAYEIHLAEDKVEIFQGLCEPETLHSIGLGRIGDGNIVEGCMGYGCSCVFLNRLEHVPGFILKNTITGDSVEDED